MQWNILARNADLLATVTLALDNSLSGSEGFLNSVATRRMIVKN